MATDHGDSLFQVVIFEYHEVSLLFAIWSLNPHDHTMEDYCGPIRPKTLAECLV
jgi:hypothetical protein